MLRTTPSASGFSAMDEYGTWPLDRLANFIEQSFHRYIRKSTPAICEQLRELRETCGAEYPELAEIERLFIHATDELEKHLLHEEHDLFPAIQMLYATTAASDDTPQITAKLIGHLLQEHNAERTLFERIAQLTSDYTAPTAACERLRNTYEQLHEFDRKLCRHIQLENDVLFPTAIELTEHHFTGKEQVLHTEHAQ